MLGTKWTFQRRDPDILKGAVAGLLGGLAASWVMNQLQAAVPAEAFEKMLGKSSEGDSDEGGDNDGGSSEPATVKAAEAVAEGLFGHDLTDDEKQWAGPAVHYAHGSLSAALYGALAEHPGVRAGAGLPFGAALWLVADEGAVPALGLSKAPWTFPLSVHAYSLVSHLAYGLTTEIVRRSVRHLL